LIEFVQDLLAVGVQRGNDAQSAQCPRICVAQVTQYHRDNLRAALGHVLRPVGELVLRLDVEQTLNLLLDPPPIS
jgi:hypothetical protein